MIFKVYNWWRVLQRHVRRIHSFLQISHRATLRLELFYTNTFPYARTASTIPSFRSSLKTN